jgi:hypothetical protein
MTVGMSLRLWREVMLPQSPERVSLNEAQQARSVIEGANLNAAH